MAVETRVIIDANASNAIKEIGRLDTAAGEADKAIAELDGATVDVDTDQAVSALEDLEFTGEDVRAALDKLDAERVTIAVDESDVVDATGDVAKLEAATDDPFRIEFDVDADKLDKVKRSADDIDDSGRAASTAIGGIGNSVSELPGVGALGGMAESMGQLAEGALEGEISVGKLVATAGGLAGVAVVAKLVGDHFDKLAAVRAWRKEQVDEYTDSLREADTVLEGIIAKLETDGSIGAMLFGDSETDITGKVAAVGLTVEQFAALVESGGDKIREWGGAMKQAGVDADAVDLVMLSAAQQAEALDDATAGAAATAAVFGTETDKAAAALKNSEDNARRYAAGMNDAATATDKVREANEKLRGDLDKREAYLNVIGDLEALEAAGITAMQSVADGTADAETATREFELQQIAAKESVLDYIDSIEGIPPEKETEILALIDQGKYAEAEAALDTLSKNRTVYVNVYGNIDPKLLNSPYLPYIPKPAADTGARSLTVNVNATPSMRETDAAIARWDRINGG